MQRHEDKKATQLVVGILAPNFKKELMQDLKTNVFFVRHSQNLRIFAYVNGF
jgi:hypothetical protein